MQFSVSFSLQIQFFGMVCQTIIKMILRSLSALRHMLTVIDFQFLKLYIILCSLSAFEYYAYETRLITLYVYFQPPNICNR